MDTRIAGSCWWHVGLDTPRSGVEKRVWSPPPPAMGRRRGGPRPKGQGLVDGGMLMRATPPGRQGLMMLSYWAGHPALVGRVERKVVGLDTPP